MQYEQSQDENEQRNITSFFNFQLRPITEIIPLGSPQQPELNWFGLTDGWYWLNTGNNELFRYSDKLLAHWRQESPEDFISPYVDYYIVRLWEDVLQILPYVFDPLPTKLVTMLTPLENWNRWDQRAQKWMEDLDTQEARDTYFEATNWWRERLLYTGYLNAGPLIGLWNDKELIHCVWDNQERLLEGVPVWATQSGEITLPVPVFRVEVTSFHERFMAMMGERIKAVKAGWSRPEIALDITKIEEEQSERSRWLTKYLGKIPSPTGSSWDSIFDAIRRIEASSEFSTQHNDDNKPE